MQISVDLIFVCKQFVAASKNMKAQLHLNSNIKEKYEDRAKGVRADRIPLRKITLPLVLLRPMLMMLKIYKNC